MGAGVNLKWLGGCGGAQRLPGRADGARINAANASLPPRLKRSFFAYLAFFMVKSSRFLVGCLSSISPNPCHPSGPWLNFLVSAFFPPSHLTTHHLAIFCQVQLGPPCPGAGGWAEKRKPREMRGALIRWTFRGRIIQSFNHFLSAVCTSLRTRASNLPGAFRTNSVNFTGWRL